MSLNKLFFGSLLVTSSLAVISSVNAGLDDDGNIKVSQWKLKAAYESRDKILKLKNGSKFIIKDADPKHKPNFNLFTTRIFERALADTNNKYKCVFTKKNDGTFQLKHEGFKEPVLALNAATGRYEPTGKEYTRDYYYFNLILTPTTEEPTPEIEDYTDFKDFKVSQVSNGIKTAPKQDFLTYYDKDRKLYCSMEFVTKESQSWWERRLGWEAYVGFKKRTDEEKERYLRLSLEELGQMNSSHVAYIAGMGMPYPSESYDPLGREHQEVVTLMNKRNGNTAQETQSVDTDLEMKVQSHYIYNNYNQGDYLSAWRGFLYNLDHSQEAPTWVAYMTSEPVNGPLYKTLKVTSPALKMAMTVGEGSCFYAPLGVYKSTVAQLFDGNESNRGLSLPFQCQVAYLMGQIDPEIKYAVVRPLGKMKEAFEATRLPYSRSIGEKVKSNAKYPSVLATGFSEANKGIPFAGRKSFVIYDPRVKEIHQIGTDHPFSKSPFLGGVDDWKLVQAFPFLTIPIEALQKNVVRHVAEPSTENANNVVVSASSISVRNDLEQLMNRDDIGAAFRYYMGPSQNQSAEECAENIFIFGGHYVTWKEVSADDKAWVVDMLKKRVATKKEMEPNVARGDLEKLMKRGDINEAFRYYMGPSQNKTAEQCAYDIFSVHYPSWNILSAEDKGWIFNKINEMFGSK